MKRMWLVIIAFIVVAITAAVVFYFVQNNNDSQTPSHTTQTEQQTINPQTPAEQSTSTTEQQTYPVKVYYSRHPESDNDPSKTFPVDRISPNIGVAKYSISELLKGPTTQEQSQNYFTYVRLRNDTSNCGGDDFTIKIENSIATLRFCKTFDHIGSISDGQAESNIKDTLKQFSSVQKVVILNKNGNCEFDLSGLNLCLQ